LTVNDTTGAAKCDDGYGDGDDGGGDGGDDDDDDDDSSDSGTLAV
jgi:hypothetical protein